jgi:hypothetical protein
MENQTRYDLNAAIENWLAELAAQPNLTSDDRRELETHLRDAIAGFQQRGLNDEESFWLACKRVGQPPQLGEEFRKASLTITRWESLFWLAFVVLAMPMWFLGKMGFRQLVVNFGDIRSFFANIDGIMQLSLSMFLSAWPVFALAGMLAKIRTSPRFSVLSPFLKTWSRITVAAVVLTVFSYNQIFLLLLGSFVRLGINVSFLGLFALVIWLFLPLRIQTKLKEIVSSKFPKRA